VTSRCLQGDARQAASYGRLLGDERADLLLTDPPYCLLVRRRKGGDERDPKARERKLDRGPVGRFEDVRSYRTFTEAWMPAAVARLRGDAPLVLWTNFLGKEPLRTVARSLGYGHLWGEFVWAKRTREGDGSELILRVYEVALILGRDPQPLLAPSDTARTLAVAAGYDDDGEAARWGSHPNHKPFGVLEPLLRSFSKPGQRILDPFSGSCSVGAAAVALGRTASCLELEPDWAARGQDRLQQVGSGGSAPAGHARLAGCPSSEPRS
jgi:site-specific DNA-methyltransferase (adenine-specific)